MFDLVLVRNPQYAGRKLRWKIWNADGLTSKLISPSKIDDQRGPIASRKVAHFNGWSGRSSRCIDRFYCFLFLAHIKKHFVPKHYADA